MLWLLITLIMAAAIALICWPFLRRTRLADGASADIYRAQLAELEREEAASLISTDDARMARTEIQRRLLATSGGATTLKEADMTLTDRTTFIAVAASLAIGSALVYGAVGSPAGSVSSHPAFAADTMGALAAATTPQGGQMSVAPVDEMIGNLEARLASAPNDVEGWRMLGWSKFRTDDYAGAAAAYAQAAKLAPQDAETLSAYGEALARAAGGMVTPDAEEALRAAVKLDASDARARFLLGLKKEQQGNPQAALNDWLSMLEGAEPDAPWYDEVRTRAVELSQSAGIDISKRLPEARATPEATMDAGRPAGPSATQVSEAAAMPPEARQAMIDGMVSRLDARLKADPTDLEGWLKLIRARRVLGQTDLAAKAVADGQAAFAKDAAARARLQQAFSAPLDIASN